MRLCRPRQWGACWLAGQLWQALQLDRFWADRLPPSRKGTRWDQVLQVLVSYRLIAPGSEWKLHRDWFGSSAMADLLGADFGLAEAHKLYACHDFLLQHKADLFSHLMARWHDLFNANFDVLLYDLTSTYFEINASDVAEGDKRRHGYSRDKRPDCPQVVIALVVTPDGLPLAYEVLPGNTADCKTLRMFLAKIEQQYGRARRVWVMDRGIPTEAVLAEMRGSDPPVQYLVGTPKGRLSRLEKKLLAKPWQEARAGVAVKLLAEDGEVYVYAESVDRVSKERAMRRRQLKWLWKRLRELAAMEVPREEMLMKLGAARARAPTAWRLVDIEMDKESAMGSACAGSTDFCAAGDVTAMRGWCIARWEIVHPRRSAGHGFGQAAAAAISGWTGRGRHNSQEICRNRPVGLVRFCVRHPPPKCPRHRLAPRFFPRAAVATAANCHSRRLKRAPQAARVRHPAPGQEWQGRCATAPSHRSQVKAGKGIPSAAPLSTSSPPHIVPHPPQRS